MGDGLDDGTAIADARCDGEVVEAGENLVAPGDAAGTEAAGDDLWAPASGDDVVPQAAITKTLRTAARRMLPL